MLGLLDLVITDERGDVRQFRDVRVLNAADDTPAALYNDALGLDQRADNLLQTNDKGRASARCTGRFKVVADEAPSNVLVPLVEVPLIDALNGPDAEPVLMNGQVAPRVTSDGFLELWAKSTTGVKRKVRLPLSEDGELPGGGSGGGAWGAITGSISAQTDLANALAAASTPTSFAGLTGSATDNASLVSALAAAAAAPKAFSVLTGDPLANNALADIIKHTPSDMVFNASRYGVNTTDTAEQQTTALEVLEAAAYTLATTGLRKRAILIIDRMFTLTRPFVCRDRVVPVAPMRSGFGFQPAENFVGQALAVSLCKEQYFYVGMVQPWTNIEFDGLRQGVYRGDATIIKNAPGCTGATFSNGFVPQVGDLIENDGLDFPTFISTVEDTGGGTYTIGFTNNAAWDNTNVGDPTLNKRRLQLKRGTGTTSRTCTASTASRTMTVSSTAGLVQGMRIASTKLGDNTRIVSVGSGNIVLNKVPIQNGTGPLFAWTELEGLVAEFAQVGIADWDDNNKCCRISTDNLHIHDTAGNGLTVRGNRTGAHIWETRTTSCFGHGMELTSSDAYVIRAESGENFRHNLVWQGATPRATGEFYSNNNSLWASVKMGGDDKLTLYDSEVTGRIEGNGTSSPESIAPAFNCYMLNQRMGKGNIHPDPTFPMCLMHGRSNMRFMVRGGTVVSEIPIKYLWYWEPGSTATCDIADIVLETRPGQAATLFSTAISNAPQTLTLRAVNPTTGRPTYGLSTSGVQARADGVAVDSGLIGSSRSQTRLKSSALALTNATAAVMRTITLTPGVWVVKASVAFQGDTAATGTRGQACITSGTTIVDDAAEAYWQVKTAFSAVSGSLFNAQFGDVEIAVSVDTVINLVVHCNFTAGTVSAYGKLGALCVG